MLRTEQIGDTYVLNYRYDDNGTLVSVSSYNISTEAVNILYAQTNTRGDVIALYDGDGDIRTIYTYDSWGKLISVTDGEGNALGANKLGTLNSIRYRGYVYDSETGLYYLQSRYYDPEVGRFLNADSVDYIGYSDSVISYNVFAYCENEPIRRLDINGKTHAYADVDYWTGVIKSVGKKVLLSFLTNYLLKGFKTIEESIKIGYNEKTQMFNAKVKYYKSNDNINSFKVEYGDRYGWWYSCFSDNLTSTELALNYSETVFEAGLVTATKPGESRMGDIIIFTFLTIFVLIFTEGKANNYLKVYSKVWGADGKDPNDEEGYILFKVSSEKGLNGYYLYRYDTQYGEVLMV